MDKFATSNKNITYYLGAGASAETMPLVNDTNINGKAIRGIPRSFRELAALLNVNATTTNDNLKYKKFIVGNLIYLAEKAELFGTIDTYAKYLYLSDKNKLKDLKQTLIFFFLYEQCIKKFYDKRALIFLTTILQHNTVFPTNIKILSWNYDYQIEMAALNFVSPKFSKVSGAFKRKQPLIEHFPSNGILTDAKFQLIHLNGCAGYYKVEGYSEYVYDEKIIDLNALYTICQNANMDLYLNFAWEKNIISERAIQEAEKIAEMTDVLVVIGYTFPVFNRDIDKKIFQKLSQRNGLKIYFQDPIKDGKFLKDQFDLDPKIDIVPISDVKNYHIPVEL